MTGLYEGIAARGFAYGPAFRGLRAAWRDGDTVYAEIAPEDGEHLQGTDRFRVHPALLDAALHTVALTVADGTDTVVPFTFQDVVAYTDGPAALRVRLVPAGEHTHQVTLLDGTGAPVAEIGALTLRAVDTASLPAATGGAGALHTLRWIPASAGTATAPVHLVGPAEELDGVPGLVEAVRHADPAALATTLDEATGTTETDAAAEPAVPRTVLAVVPPARRGRGPRHRRPAGRRARAAAGDRVAGRGRPRRFPAGPADPSRGRHRARRRGPHRPRPGRRVGSGARGAGREPRPVRARRPRRHGRLPGAAARRPGRRGQ